MTRHWHHCSSRKKRIHTANIFLENLLLKIRFYKIGTLATSTLCGVVFDSGWNRDCDAERHFFDMCNARKYVAQRYQKVFKVCSHVRMRLRAAVTTHMFLLLLIRHPDRHSALWHRETRTSFDDQSSNDSPRSRINKRVWHESFTAETQIDGDRYDGSNETMGVRRTDVLWHPFCTVVGLVLKR